MNEVWLIHNSKQLPANVKQLMTNSRWRIESVPFRKVKSTLKERLPDVIVVVVEGKKSDWHLNCVSMIKAVDDNLPVIALMPSKSLGEAVSLMKAGVFDCMSLPVQKERLIKAMENAVNMYSLTKKVYLLESETNRAKKFDDIVGQSDQIKEVFQMIKLVAKSGATVLVLGESGTGKELVARAVHKNSSRFKKPFVDINCGAIPHELLENELFGHERGAYTGADRRYLGSFERANGGTVFLDEISEMDSSLQVKLLRFLQERKIIRVGGNVSISLDVRIIAATNKNLSIEVKEGRFREDLFYRLNVVPIEIPSLRERPDDIPLLAQAFLQKFSAANEKIFMDIAPPALQALANYDWRGNVRELENLMERVVVLNNDTRLKLSHLPQNIKACKGGDSQVMASSMDESSIIPLDQVERYAIESALQQCMGNVAEVARRLKVGQATLYRKIRKYGLRGG